MDIYDLLIIYYIGCCMGGSNVLNAGRPPAHTFKTELFLSCDDRKEE
jgi:hypothetical protein